MSAVIIPVAVQIDHIRDIFATTDPWVYGEFVSADAQTVLLLGQGGTPLWASRSVLAPVLFPDTPTPEAPSFTHDCDACVYLGSGRIDGQPVDFYRHPDTDARSTNPTALARTGNEGRDYASMPESMLATAQPLTGPLAEYRRRYLSPAS